MGLFDLLDEEEQKLATGASEQVLTVSDSSSVVTVENHPEQPEPQMNAKDDGGDGWISADAKKTPNHAVVDLYETKLCKKILPEELVWAPNYRYKDRLFPARLCANDEVKFESWVKTWPLPDDEAVVEIFRQEKTSTSRPLIIVKQKMLLPYWKRSGNDVRSNYEGSLEWNETRLDNLHATLHEKHSKANAQYIFDAIKLKAQECLEKALAYEAEMADVPEEPEPIPIASKSKRGQSKKAAKVPSPPSPKSPEPEAKKLTVPISPFFKTLLQAQKTPSKADMSLSIGDYISYTSREGNKITRITGFTSNPKIPLELEDKTVLHDTDLVKRLHPDPTSSKGYSSDDTKDTKHLMLLKFSINTAAPPPAPKSGKKRTVSSTDSDNQESTRVVRSRK
eukprot:gene28219-34075_t